MMVETFASNEIPNELGCKSTKERHYRQKQKMKITKHEVNFLHSAAADAAACEFA
jgi:hypothetical protein